MRNRVEKHGKMTVEQILLRRRKAEVERELEEKKNLEAAKHDVEEQRATREKEKETRKKEKQDVLNAESPEEREERLSKAEYKKAKIAFKKGQEEASVREEAEKAEIRAMGQKAAAMQELPYDAEKEAEKRTHLEALAS